MQSTVNLQIIQLHHIAHDEVLTKYVIRSEEEEVEVAEAPEDMGEDLLVADLAVDAVTTTMALLANVTTVRLSL